MFVEGGEGNKVGSLDDFKEWLKDQSGFYTYENTSECAFAQYLKARGHTNVCVTPYFYQSDQVAVETLPTGLDFLLATNTTFGRLLDALS